MAPTRINQIHTRGATASDRGGGHDHAAPSCWLEKLGVVLVTVTGLLMVMWAVMVPDVDMPQGVALWNLKVS